MIGLAGGCHVLHHFHLAKCGGTTLNRWLDLQCHDLRTGDPTGKQATLRWGEGWAFKSPELVAFALSLHDVVHSHAPICSRDKRKPFLFTLLREPRERLLSQIADWSRLGDHDTIGLDAEVQEGIAACRTASLRELLTRFGRGALQRYWDNYMTRALAACREGENAFWVADPESLQAAALAVLDQEFDFVGLTEEFEVSRRALCAVAGLPPAETSIEVLNISRPEPRPIPDDCIDLMHELTHVDDAIYRQARCIFDQRHRSFAAAYDAATFERNNAARLLAPLEPFMRDGAACHSVRGPIYGSGFHGRDAARTQECAVWMGPAPSSVIYVPVSAQGQIEILLWVRGYAEPTQRDSLRFLLNTAETPHRFEPAEGCHDLIVVGPMYSRRPFVRLDVFVERTVATGQPDGPGHDPRLRGISFDGYGWRPR